MRCCGECINHDPLAERCKLGLSYAAFVRADAPANGCPGFVDRERANGESQAQSECRPAPGPFSMWQQAMKKP